MTKTKAKTLAIKNRQIDITQTENPLDYEVMIEEIKHILENSHQTTTRAINSVMTTTYWLIGQRIVEYEQHGQHRAEYGETVLARLSKDLSTQFGRGFSVDRLEDSRLFYQAYPLSPISETLSRKSKNTNESRGFKSKIKNRRNRRGRYSEFRI